MATITVKTPFKDQPFILTWEDRVVSAKGTKSSLLYWNYLKTQGLYGPFGHAVNLKDCFLLDLVTALYNRVPRTDVTLDEKAKQIQKLEERETMRVPKGAMT